MSKKSAPSTPQRSPSGSQMNSGFPDEVLHQCPDELIHQLRTRLSKLALENDDLYQHAPCGYHSADAEGTLIRINDTELKWLGYTREEVLGKKKISDFYTPASKALLEENFKRFLSIGHVEALEYELVGKDGSIRNVLLSATSVIDDTGKFVMSRAVMLDITARKITEENLRKSQLQSKVFVRDAPISIAMFDKDMNYLATSDRWVIEYGRGYTDLVGRNHYEVHPDVPEEWKIAHQKGQHGETIKNADDKWVQADGSEHWLRWAILPWTDEDGNIGGIIISAEDITESKRADEKLRLWADSFEKVDFGLAMADAVTNTFISVNPTFARERGYDREELIGKSIMTVFPTGNVSQVKSKISELDEGSHIVYESMHICRDGRQFPVLLDITTIKSAEGVPVRRIAYALDITDRKFAERELKIAATAFETQEGILISDANNVILRVNHAFTEITGYTADEVIGKNPRLLSSGLQDKDFYKNMWAILNSTGYWSGEVWNRKKNGDIYPESLTITAVKDSHGNVTNYVGNIADITRRKNDEKLIDNLAYYDPLTGLPNRRLLQDRLAQGIASSSRSGRTGALLFIDLDYFKTINDTLGHATGDLLLQQVAKRIQSCLRDGDTVSRPGGDEFIVMLNDLSPESIEAATQAESVGEKILAALNQPYQLCSHHCHNTSSIGISLFGGHKISIEEVMKQADIAMYQAKKEGKNTLRFFDPKMQESVDARARLENELRTAIQEQQFQLYYQIQTDSSNRAIGAEALIRWNHPERGLIPPVEFIPITEETNMILAIGNWVLMTACRQIRKWERDDLVRELVISVNVSAKQFHQADFVDRVKDAVRQNQIDPRHLKLELTESMLVENIEETIVKMQNLKAIGIILSLDDFGTGYSSLRYLQRLPIDQLKIDQSFVKDIYANEGNQAIVLTIIHMALSLNLDVIAEGVETEAQLEFLALRGCEKFQGYLFGKPLSAEQFQDFWLNN